MEPTPDTYYELLWAFGAIWILLVIFVLKLMNEQRKTGIELKRVQDSLDSSKT